MDLIAIAQSIWRHKFATLPILALMMFGAFYVIEIKKPMYQATSSYILLAPPAPPSASQIQRNPALARIHSDNPYLRFGDLSIVVQLLTQRISTDTARQALVKEGADNRYTAAPSVQIGATAPIIQITGIGSSARSAMRSASLVGQAIASQLDSLQAAANVNKTYWISMLQLQAPDQAQAKVSSKVRTLIAFMALGIVLMFVVISVLKALAERKEPGAISQQGGLASPHQPNGAASTPFDTRRRATDGSAWFDRGQTASFVRSLNGVTDSGNEARERVAGRDLAGGRHSEGSAK
jgi:hypothetical protein